MDTMHFWSVARTRAAIAGGETSVEEIVHAHLARIEAVNPAINAIVDEVADPVAEARRLDALPAAERGPLHGVPVTIKINVDVAGGRNTNGAPGLKDTVCREDSPLVENLRKAGAVIVGRTNVPEFSLRFFSSNPLYGTTRNPWDETRTPGGSSGGASAALACGIGTIAHGNDLGGSLRYPAYCCGLVSIRPSMGRVPAYNPSAPAERPPVTLQMSVQGPITRCVADAREALTVMAGRSARDPMWTAAPDAGRPRRARPRIGVAPRAFGRDVDPAVSDALGKAQAAAEAAGLDVVEVDLPDVDRMVELWGQLLCTEVEHAMLEGIRANGSPDIMAVLEGYRDRYGLLDLPGYLAACAERTAIARRWSVLFDEVDALLLPVSTRIPFPQDHDRTGREGVEYVLDGQRPLYVVNLIGLPAVAVPTHLADGLPVGVQLVGAMHDDFPLLDLAERLENELGTLGVPPLVADL